jgi:hypothetical protein
MLKIAECLVVFEPIITQWRSTQTKPYVFYWCNLFRPNSQSSSSTKYCTKYKKECTKLPYRNWHLNFLQSLILIFFIVCCVCGVLHKYFVTYLIKKKTNSNVLTTLCEKTNRWRPWKRNISFIIKVPTRKIRCVFSAKICTKCQDRNNVRNSSTRLSGDKIKLCRLLLLQSHGWSLCGTGCNRSWSRKYSCKKKNKLFLKFYIMSFEIDSHINAWVFFVVFLISPRNYVNAMPLFFTDL